MRIAIFGKAFATEFDDAVKHILRRIEELDPNPLVEAAFMRMLDDRMKVSDKLQSSPYSTIMVDETTDITNEEQVTIVMRMIDDDFEVYEEFLGLYAVPSIDAAHLFSIIKDCMLRFNLPLSKLRGQCYDGCSTMSGIRSGVAKRVQDEESRAVFTHCYCHSLNLAASDSVKNSQLVKSALETTHEITKNHLDVMEFLRN